MKSKMFALITAFLSLSAQADVVSCSFTEPFFSLEINTETGTMTKTEPNFEEGGEGVITTEISDQIKIKKLNSKKVSQLVEVPRYLVTSGKQKIMVLELDYQGSNGMSDHAFPYSTRYEGNYGGCESDIVKAHLFNYEN